MSQFLRDQASDSDEVVTPLMLDGTYLSMNFATLGPSSLTAAVWILTLNVGGWMLVPCPCPSRNASTSCQRLNDAIACYLKEAVLDSPLTDAVSRNPKEASVRLGHKRQDE
jgi:hypothetical protein